MDRNNEMVFNALHANACEILEEDETGLFLHDKTAGSWMLFQPDLKTARAWLEKRADQPVDEIVLAGSELAALVQQTYNLGELVETVQLVWKEPAAPVIPSDLDFVRAGEADYPWIHDRYDLISEPELLQTVLEGRMTLAKKGNETIGFAGFHPEGSMGLLYIEPEWRRHGYARALEAEIIRQALAKDLVPYANVFKDNAASLALQEQLGLQREGQPVYWLFRAEED